MTFLKWLGYAVTVLGDLSGILPAVKAFTAGLSPKVSAAVGTVADALQKIVGVVQSVEVSFAAATSVEAKTGAQKLAAATPGVQAILQEWVGSGVLGSSKVKDPALFLKASAEIAGGTADLLNSLEAPAPAPTTGAVQAAQAQLRTTASAVAGR